jgi:cytidylate kinase
MRIVTISREFGSGGRELGKRLADELNFDYYDREIIDTIAHNTGTDPNYVFTVLENHGWKNIPLTFRQSVKSPLTVQYAQTELLIEQKRVIEEIAKHGNDCVIVGRNADVLLQDYCPFNIFVCADVQAKIRRCMERATQDENLTPKVLKRKMQNIDKQRKQIRDILTGSKWGEPHNYHVTINTTDWEIKQLTPAVTTIVNRWFGRKQ